MQYLLREDDREGSAVTNEAAATPMVQRSAQRVDVPQRLEIFAHRFDFHGSEQPADEHTLRAKPRI